MSSHISGYEIRRINERNAARQQINSSNPHLRPITIECFDDWEKRIFNKYNVPKSVQRVALNLVNGGPLRFPTDDDVKSNPLSVYDWCALMYWRTSSETDEMKKVLQYWKDRNWQGLPKPPKTNKSWRLRLLPRQLVHGFGYFICSLPILFFFSVFGDLLWGILKFILQGICFPFTLIGMATGVVSEDYGAGMGLAVGMFIFAAVVMAIVKAFR